MLVSKPKRATRKVKKLRVKWSLWDEFQRGTLWEKINALVSVLTLLAAVFGIWWVFNDFANNAAQKRVDRTLTYVERYHADSLVQARERLAIPWFQYTDVLQSAREVGQLRRETFDKIAESNIAEDQANEGRLVLDVLLLHGFFEELSTCVEHNRCDRQTACRHFAKPAKNLMSLYSDRVIRTTYRVFDSGNAGPGTGAFLERCGG